MNFIKTVFASFFGFLLSIITLTIFFIFLAVASISFSSGDEVKVENNSVLEIKMSDEITEMPIGEDPFAEISNLLNNESATVSLSESIKAIELASKDDHIKGIYLSGGFSGMGWAKMEELRNALLKFKADTKSKKFIYAYSEVYMQKAYYLSSVADSIFLNKTGLFEFSGLSSEQIFLKGMFDKIGVEPKLIRAGKYKSAGEMFIKDHISPENKLQISVYINSIYNQMIKQVASARKISVEDLNSISVEGKVRFPEDAVKYKMVDKLIYYDQFLSTLRKQLGLTAKKEIPTVSLVDYVKSNKSKMESFEKERIAVIYAVGEINSGEGSDTKIGSDGLARAIREARLDENIKAIVLRINSPGGSAMASDIIWREVVLANQLKPVIASYGDVAASGGYYIGAPARKIFAQPNTITGSIGVFALLPNLTKLYEDKLGIHWDRVKTGKFSDLGNPNRAMTSEEELILQNYVDTTYMQFKQRVAQGRKMNIDMVDSIAQGRVWTGIDAKSIGLVDEMGSLDDAIKYAVKESKVSKYSIEVYPKLKNNFFEKMKNPMISMKEDFLKEELGTDYHIYQSIKAAKQRSGVMMYLPYNLEVK